MQQRIEPLEEKLSKDGRVPYTKRNALETLRGKVARISRHELAQDLFPLFENRTFIETWVDAFHENFERFSEFYMKF